MGAKKWVTVLVILGFILGFHLSPVNGQMSTSVWSKVTNNGDAVGDIPCTMTFEEIVSLTDCGSACFGHEGCYAFCFTDVTSSCYGVGTTTSPECQVPADVDQQCFVKSDDACPWADGYSVSGGRCIKLFSNEKMSFSLASERCGRDGAHLYNFKTDDDRQSLVDFMNDSGVSVDFAWVGAMRDNEGGNFTWADGTPLPSTSSLWYPGEPNGFDGLEDCVMVVLTLQPSFTLNDARCSEHYPFVCQLDVYA